MSYIAVGVDGSQGAQRALTWALEEGRRLAIPVRVLHAWWTPPEYAAYPAIPVDHADEVGAMRRAGEELVERMLTEAKEQAEGVDVRVEVVNEPPALALVDRSHDADRVVVGTRGLGGFRSLLLGSVSQQVVHHAHCPVVVIPAAADA